MNTTDKDYIEAAVELADGWRMITEYHYRHSAWLPGDNQFTVGTMLVMHKDALAAQLARQYRERYVKSRFLTDDRLFYEDDVMNTIKVIVDSGVLK